jgi:hypothetical protein
MDPQTALDEICRGIEVGTNPDEIDEVAEGLIAWLDKGGAVPNIGREDLRALLQGLIDREA